MKSGHIIDDDTLLDTVPYNRDSYISYALINSLYPRVSTQRASL